MSEHFDVIILSHLALPGGTTSSNVQEIQAQQAAGLKTGLIHQPVYDWNVARPINSKIMALLDHPKTSLIPLHQQVSCDVLVIRGTQSGEKLMDDLPIVNAKKTVVIVNQTPMRQYDDDGGVDRIYFIDKCAESYERHFGEHTWHPIGPSVRSRLTSFHSAELQGVNLAQDDWVNIIDLDSWRRESRPPSAPAVRVGRHSRDHPSKWPETRHLLTSAYPVDGNFEVRILGGADSAIELLGESPANWQVLPFDSVAPREFLHDLDIYAYFTTSTLAEAFGRAPLEAMAAGVPVLIPESFRGLFEDGAVYTDPPGVKDAIEALMSNPDMYQRQVDAGHNLVQRKFSFDTHIQRLRALGVGSASR